jgi:hypothetical protein
LHNVEIQVETAKCSAGWLPGTFHNRVGTSRLMFNSWLRPRLNPAVREKEPHGSFGPLFLWGLHRANPPLLVQFSARRPQIHFRRIWRGQPHLLPFTALPCALTHPARDFVATAMETTPFRLACPDRGGSNWITNLKHDSGAGCKVSDLLERPGEALCAKILRAGRSETQQTGRDRPLVSARDSLVGASIELRVLILWGCRSSLTIPAKLRDAHRHSGCPRALAHVDSTPVASVVQSIGRTVNGTPSSSRGVPAGMTTEVEGSWGVTSVPYRLGGKLLQWRSFTLHWSQDHGDWNIS